jgi:hypothetical protein
MQGIKDFLNVIWSKEWLKKGLKWRLEIQFRYRSCLVAELNIPVMVHNKQIGLKGDIQVFFLTFKSLKDSSEKRFCVDLIVFDWGDK